MNTNTIVFWQPMVSPHMVPLLRALKDRGFDVVLVVERAELEDRKKLGWELPDLGEVKCIDLSAVRWESAFEELRCAEALNVFSGTRAYPIIWQAIQKCIRLNCKFVLLGETLDSYGLKGTLRRARAVYDAFRLRKHVLFILAIGDIGANWYQSVGFFAKDIFPWAYFVNVDQRDEKFSSGNRIRFLYVGRFIRSKGIDWLFRTIERLRQHRFEFDFVGDGPLLDRCRSIAKNYTHCKVNFYGSMSMEQVQACYSAADYLILPSTGKDGWGAVVNEALQCGVRCIVSSRCGSSCIIKDDRAGYVIDPANENSLYDIMARILEENKRLATEERSFVKDYSSRISPEAGAEYLEKIIRYSLGQGSARPVAPWHKA